VKSLTAPKITESRKWLRLRFQQGSAELLPRVDLRQPVQRIVFRVSNVVTGFCADAGKCASGH
jgi:hypothetical protein